MGRPRDTEPERKDDECRSDPYGGTCFPRDCCLDGRLTESPDRLRPAIVPIGGGEGPQPSGLERYHWTASNASISPAVRASHTSSIPLLREHVRCNLAHCTLARLLVNS